MICEWCNGKGEIINDALRWTSCPVCGGKGFVDITNEKWFCNLSTKEKAKWLENKMTWAAQEQGTFTAKGWEIWLKQPHTFK